MDSEKLKDAEDCVEINKLTSLRLFLYQLRSLERCPDAGEDLYEDVKNIVKFVETKVEPKLGLFTSNYIENAKRWIYMMLKYAGQDFVNAVDARRKGIDLPTRKQNLILRLKEAHEEYFDIVFDPTYTEWLDVAKIVELCKKYCKLMSYVFFNYEKDIQTLDKNDTSICYFCQANASVLGVGRIEGMCEECEKEGLVCETYTKFVIDRYKNICDHYIGDMMRFKTPLDNLLANG